MRTLVVVGGALLALATRVTAQSDDRKTVGEQLFRRECASCHSLIEHRYGPRLLGVVSRVAGSEPGYTYSVSLRTACFAWDSSSLDRWLTNPRRMLPGVRMRKTVSNPETRGAIIAYLSSRSATP